MGWGRILPVGFVLWASAAAAQAPWPAQQPQQQQQAAWPGQQPQGQAAWPSSPAQASQQGGAAWPDQHAPAAAPPPMMGAPGMSPMGGGGGGAPPCITEFTKLRGEVEKRGAAAKAANEHHAPREEFCKVITALSVAAEKWAKYTEKEAKGCGIPGDAVTQIKNESEHLGKIKTQVCNAGGGPAAAGPPSLSEALGTDRMPIDDGNKATAKRGGVLDSMTGAPNR
jgi:hypothetical protein